MEITVNNKIQLRRSKKTRSYSRDKLLQNLHHSKCFGKVLSSTTSVLTESSENPKVFAMQRETKN